MSRQKPFCESLSRKSNGNQWRKQFNEKKVLNRVVHEMVKEEERLSESDSEDENFIVGSLSMIGSIKKSKKNGEVTQWHEKITLGQNQAKVEFKLDTGAEVSVLLTYSYFKKL